MYQRLDRSHGNVLGYEITGRITEEEYQRLAGELRAGIGEHGSVRLLVRAPGLPTAELSALDDDLEFAKEHLGDIERYAVVSDRKLLRFLTRVGDRFVRAESREFALEDEEAAWAWLEG
ncbi:SpoIIAA family protein [Nocardiopsis halotolerans]|uniref:STAS/SEC14 domain-containing protein n=1 Tax=Nocardiopsis halotolerans TaxID=124252 RepID=UPI00034B34FA|nr:STAS/SEC14 domain-containing protein [Nocardiopsis halotolerans]